MYIIQAEMWYPLQKNNFLPLVFRQQIVAAHAALPICFSLCVCVCVCVYFFPLARFTSCFNETLDVAKPIQLSPIVQNSASEDRASELAGTHATPAHLHGHTPCKGLIGGREWERKGQRHGFNWRMKRKKKNKRQGKMRVVAGPPFLWIKNSPLPSLIYPPRAHNAATVFIKPRGGQEQKINSAHSPAHWVRMAACQIRRRGGGGQRRGREKLKHKWR